MLNHRREQVETMTQERQTAVDDAPGEPGAEEVSGHVTVSSPGHAAAATGTHRQLVWLRILPEIAVLGFCVLLYGMTADLDTTVAGPGPAFFPRLLSALLAVAMLARLGQHVGEIRRERAGVAERMPTAAEEDAEAAETVVSMPRVWLAIGLSAGYVAASLYLGWIIATVAFLIAFLFLSGKRKLWLTVPLSAGLTLGLAYLFVKVVYIALPTGTGVFDQLTVQILRAIGAF